MGCSHYGLYLQGVTLHGTEIEAFDNWAVPIYLKGNAVFIGATISFADPREIDHIVEIDPACATWQITGLTFIFRPPALGAQKGIPKSKAGISRLVRSISGVMPPMQITLVRAITRLQ